MKRQDNNNNISDTDPGSISWSMADTNEALSYCVEATYSGLPCTYHKML